VRNRLPLLAAAGCVLLLAAFRPYNQGAKAKAAWMTVSSIKTGQAFYLEVAQDGKAVLREETAKTVLTRRGSIKPQVVKDFFREIDNSEIVNSQNVKESKMVFYRGDMLELSAYISGELKRVEAPLNNFGEAFSYAFGEVRKAVTALPEEKAMAGFLRAVPVEGEELELFRSKTAVDGEVKNVETAVINKVKPLMAAIKEPHRLVPLEKAEDLKVLQEFVTSKRLQGLMTQFYLPSTRGTFRCEVVTAARAAAAAGKKPAAAPAPAKRGRR